MAGDLPAGDGQRGSTPPGGGVPGAGQPMDQAAPRRRAQSERRGEPQRAAQRQSHSQPRPQPQPQPQPRTEPPQSGAKREPQAHSQRQGSSPSPARPRPDQEPSPPGLSGVDDDWDQEASLAAFVADVEAGRAHDPDDLYDGEPWDSELDLPALDAVPGEERAGAAPILRCPSWMQASCPAVGPARRPVPAVPLPAVPVRGTVQDSPPEEPGIPRCRARRWPDPLMRQRGRTGSMRGRVMMN